MNGVCGVSTVDLLAHFEFQKNMILVTLEEILQVRGVNYDCVHNHVGSRGV